MRMAKASGLRRSGTRIREERAAEVILHSTMFPYSWLFIGRARAGNGLASTGVIAIVNHNHSHGKPDNG
jgi:hypothetical protein